MGALNDALTWLHTMHFETKCWTSNIACLLNNINLETNYRFDVPQNVPILHVHASLCFLVILNMVLVTYTCPFGHILTRCCPSQWYFLAFWKTLSFSCQTQFITQAIAKHYPSCMNYIQALLGYWTDLHIMPKTWFSWLRWLASCNFCPIIIM